MFVKILKKKSKKILRETLYECENVTITHENNSILVSMAKYKEKGEKEGEKEDVSIPCEGQISIYLMNQQGKTVDSFRFGEGNDRSNRR